MREGRAGGPFFLGGVYTMLPGNVAVLDGVADACRNGGGGGQAEYDPRLGDGLERFTRGWFDGVRLVPARVLLGRAAPGALSLAP